MYFGAFKNITKVILMYNVFMMYNVFNVYKVFMMYSYSS